MILLLQCLRHKEIQLSKRFARFYDKFKLQNTELRAQTIIYVTHSGRKQQIIYIIKQSVLHGVVMRLPLKTKLCSSSA